MFTVRRPSRRREGRYAVQENSPVRLTLLNVGNHQGIIALTDHRVGKLLGVRRPGTTIFDVAQFVNVAAGVSRPNLTDVLTRPRISQEQVNTEQVTLRKVNQVLTVRANLRSNIHLPAAGCPADEFFTDVVVFGGITDVRGVDLAQGTLPEFIELFQLHT